MLSTLETMHLTGLTEHGNYTLSTAATTMTNNKGQLKIYSGH